MSRTIDRAPFAVTSDGSVLLNVAGFDVPKTLDALVRLAMEQPGAVFIGLRLTRTETSAVDLGVHDACADAASHIVGARQRRGQGRKRLRP
jgi:hypothetical protein